MRELRLSGGIRRDCSRLELRTLSPLRSADFQFSEHFWAEKLFSLGCRKQTGHMVLVPLHLQQHERSDNVNERLPQRCLFHESSCYSSPRNVVQARAGGLAGSQQRLKREVSAGWPCSEWGGRFICGSCGRTAPSHAGRSQTVSVCGETRNKKCDDNNDLNDNDNDNNDLNPYSHTAVVDTQRKGKTFFSLVSAVRHRYKNGDEKQSCKSEYSHKDPMLISSHESGTKPLTFTFVPSIGRLPTHFEVVDVSKFLVRLPEEPKDLSCQEITYKVQHDSQHQIRAIILLQASCCCVMLLERQPVDPSETNPQHQLAGQREGRTAWKRGCTGVRQGSQCLLRAEARILHSPSALLSNTVSDELALKSGARQDSVHPVHTDSSQKIFQPPSCNSNRGEMQANDLFKAEFILITDSGEEDEVATASNSAQQAPNGYGPISAQLLAASHVSAGGEAKKPPVDLHGSSATPSHSTTDQQKQQLISALSTYDHLSSKTPAVHLISPTNSKVACGDMVNLNQASSLEDSHKNWQSPTGSSKQDSSLYFQSTFHSPPSSVSNISSCASNSCYSSSPLYNNLQTPSLHTPGCVYKTAEFTTSSVPAKSPSPSSGLPCSAEIQASPAQPLSPSSSKRLNALCHIPVHIVTHSLSPSPKPLSPPSLYGSSSTIGSVSESYAQMSYRENPAKSGIKPPLPTRLTLLTAILRSGSSQQRPLSPASCPTFSPNSLGSSTLAIDQKFETTPPTPKKYVSSPSIGLDSPSREGCWLSGFARHMPLTSQPHPTPRARSPSPKKHLSLRTLSPESLSPLSSPIASHRKSVASPWLKPALPTSAMPPHAPIHSSLSHPPSPPEEMHYPLSRSRGPQRSQRVHTYSPIFTCQSYALLSSPSQSGMVSPTLEKHSSPSPSLSHSTSRSKSDSSHKSNQELSASSPTPSNVSKQASTSQPDTTSPTPQTYNIHSQPLQPNSSSMHTNYRSNYYSPRPEQSATSLVLKCRSPVSDKSPCTLLSRPRELTSPQSFSPPPDHENIKPKYSQLQTDSGRSNWLSEDFTVTATQEPAATAQAAKTTPERFANGARLPSQTKTGMLDQYKIKTSYKAFAAIPTNTLLMEQKALEEPPQTAVTEGTTLDTLSEMCSPAQLRQQTEELCAVIDQVLQDPLPMRRCESSPSFLQMTTESDVGKALEEPPQTAVTEGTTLDTLSERRCESSPSFLQMTTESDVGKVSRTLQRAAGRETRYASLYKSAPMVTESQLTKPGVIRPVLVKGKSTLKKKEPYQPNPFKKYLEEISDQDTEQAAVFMQIVCSNSFSLLIYITLCSTYFELYSANHTNNLPNFITDEAGIRESNEELQEDKLAKADFHEVPVPWFSGSQVQRQSKARSALAETKLAKLVRIRDV
nr:PREDICTED: muscular LMNA-interacting protein [Apteryx mantelli mantelli]